MSFSDKRLINPGNEKIKLLDNAKIILMSFGLAALAWILDSLLDSLIFHENTIIGQIITPNDREITIRLLFGSIFILFGFYIQYGITRLKWAEDALKREAIQAEDEKNKTKEVIEAIGDGIILQDTDYKIIYQNQIQNKIYGNCVGEYCYEAYEGRDSLCEDCPIEASFTDGKIHKVERRVPTDKGILYIELTGSSLRDSKGKIRGGVKVVRDITERKRAEEKLRKGELFLESIFASIQDGIGVIDKDMNILHANPTAERWYPHAAPLIGKKCYEAYHQRSERCEACPAWKTLKTGESAFNVVPKHGAGENEIGWLEIYSYPMMDAATGEMRGVIEYVRDITERRRIEKNLQKSIHQQTAILNNIPDIAWLKDKDSCFIAVNKPFAEACGVSPEDLVGKTDFDIWNRDLAEGYAADDREVMETGRRKHVEEPLIDKDGRKTWIETIKTPIYDDGGKIIGTTGISRDVTERKQIN